MDLFQHTSSLYYFGVWSIRTNNYTEASHCILNKRVGEPHINMYKLVNIIHEMGVDFKLNCAMVSMLWLAYKKSTANKNLYLNIITIA